MQKIDFMIGNCRNSYFLANSNGKELSTFHNLVLSLYFSIFPEEVVGQSSLQVLEEGVSHCSGLVAMVPAHRIETIQDPRCRVQFL